MGGESEKEDGGSTRPVEEKCKRFTLFNYWLKNEKYINWLKPTVGDMHSVTCSICLAKIVVKHEGRKNKGNFHIYGQERFNRG